LEVKQTLFHLQNKKFGNSNLRSLAIQPSIVLISSYVVLSLLMIVGLSYLLSSWKILLFSSIWAAVTGILGYSGYSGYLADFSILPPPILLLLVLTITLVIIISFSRIGASLAGLSVSLKIGFHSFRILVELLIHKAVSEGIAPPQMS
jgi:hypothetical protein